MPVIAINSLEKNVGVSSIALTFGEKINFLSGVRTCIVELNESPSFSYILERTNKVEKSLNDIIPHLNQDYNNQGLLKVIDFNSQKLKNSNLEIIYGSDYNLSDEQLQTYVNALKNIYEIVIIDYGNKPLPSVLEKNIDLNINVIQPTMKFILKLLNNKDKYLLTNTKVLINNFVGGGSDISHFIKKELQGIDIIGKLPSSNTLVNCMLRGIINIDKGKYALNLTKISEELLDTLNIKSDKKLGFFNKLFNKKQDRNSNVSIKEPQKILLGEILVEQKLCTKEDITKCLEIQKKRLKGAY